MKTLAKLSSGRYSAPILNYILVNNGKARATDLDIEITCNVENLDNGLYIGKGFDQFKIKSDLPPADFPTFRDIGKELSSFSVSRETLEYIAQGMSKEQARYYLCGICVDNTGLVSINGHVLFKEDITTGIDTKKIIPDTAIKYTIAAMKEQRQEACKIAVHEYGFILTCGNYEIKSREIDGTFPTYERVIPPKQGETFQYDAKAMKPILKEAKTLAKMLRKNTCLVLENNIAYLRHEQEQKTWETGFSKPIISAFDMGYLQMLPSGEFSQEDKLSPARIDAGNRLAVIMPMRVF